MWTCSSWLGDENADGKALGNLHQPLLPSAPFTISRPETYTDVQKQESKSASREHISKDLISDTVPWCKEDLASDEGVFVE